MLSPNQIELAERDGQRAALRLLYGLRQHLDGYDDQSNAQVAGATFLLGFANVFAECMTDALEDNQGEPAIRLFYHVMRRTPELIAQLDR